MTPFQRQVYEAMKKKEQREQEERMEAAQQGGGGGRPTKNSLAGSGGQQKQSMQGETIRYDSESDDENPEANTSFVD